MRCALTRVHPIDCRSGNRQLFWNSNKIYQHQLLQYIQVLNFGIMFVNNVCIDLVLININIFKQPIHTEKSSLDRGGNPAKQLILREKNKWDTPAQDRKRLHITESKQCKGVTIWLTTNWSLINIKLNKLNQPSFLTKLCLFFSLHTSLAERSLSDRGLLAKVSTGTVRILSSLQSVAL